jgi:hypothetical protein
MIRIDGSDIMSLIGKADITQRRQLEKSTIQRDQQ